ncbi:slit homolog 1 protein-like [Adelges cooleyi]|uniref:slit homolog 1 protein-like n=1 Tax=Adelges cooleyi TaxID=133065 RepID=UPI00217FD6BD|nr:slit homolog 1 protein-like [Adelges cooleyi]
MFFKKIALLSCIFLTSVYAKETLIDGEDSDWGGNCPRACTCRYTPFAELAVSKWIRYGLRHEAQFEFANSTEAPHNEVVDETADADDEGPKKSLKAALCLFMNVTDPKAFLGSVPADTEALILYQTTDAYEVTITGEEWHLPALVLLEIHGMSGKMHVTDGTFEEAKSVQYLSMEGVSLDRLTLEGNEPAPSVDARPYKHENIYAFNELVPMMVVDGEQSDSGEGPTGKNRLVFLQPKDAEMVPYEVYKKQTEQQAKAKKKPSSPFAGNGDLVFLRLVDCGLRDVSWEMFDGLDSLETLILDRNVIEYVPDFTFYGAVSLKSLSLADNNINRMQTTGLGGLLDLKYLNLRNNRLTSLSETTFPPLPKLETADLGGNPLETIFPHTFEVLNSTRELVLGSPAVQLVLRPSSLIGLDSLEKLRLININVAVLERSLLDGLANLIELEISGTVEHVAFDAFIEVPNIRRLVLRNCSIRSVSMDSFYGLYNLEHLDLSYNLLEELPPGMFDQQFSLKEIILNNNQIIQVPDTLFKTVSNIVLIRLDGNPLRCSCHMKSWDISLMVKDIRQVNKRVCQWEHYKKGYGCSFKTVTSYVYNKKAEPVCSSPERFNGKAVSYVLKKYLNCERKSIEKNRIAYLKKKYKEYKQTHFSDAKETKIDDNFSSQINMTTSHNQDTVVTSNKITNVAVNNSTSATKQSININSTTLDPIGETAEKLVQLNNGTFKNKNILKEEISKAIRKNKIKNTTPNDV